MGFFSSSKKKVILPWVNIESVDQLKEAILSGTKKPKLFFKHSTRCSISSMALNSFENQWSSEDELCALYFIDLLLHRDVSNTLAEMTGITHQSPQVILIQNRDILYDESHSGISARQIESILKKL